MMTGVLVGRDEAEIERRVADLLVSFGQGSAADTREWLEAAPAALGHGHAG